ncbi:MAG: hypothetical protein LBN71_03455 [Tannerella sp.]|jgi:hypothetical protein|nr:hypothetical protein [Tannerella sp.]
MAKRRLLKKEISYSFGNLFFDMLVYKCFQPDVDAEKVEALMTSVSEWNSEFISRAHHAPSRGNKKDVKQYYRKLYTDLDATLDTLSDELKQLDGIEGSGTV